MKDEQKKTLNLLSIDLEDWFHILDLRNGLPSTGEWDALPSRLELNTEIILELLSENKTIATFFVLGWIAQKYPGIIERINACGHEIACHGYRHDLISDLTPAEFRDDIRRAKLILEDTIGKKVKGYRGPGFSITLKNLWAFDVIAEEGFEYDATLYPGSHGHGGIPALPATPFLLSTLRGHRIEEFPVTVATLGKYRFGFSGGGYFRLFPFAMISGLIKGLNARKVPVMVYIHPRDLDPLTPRLKMSMKRRFKCYVNIAGSQKKLQKLLKRHNFATIQGWRNEWSESLEKISLKGLPHNYKPHIITKR